MDLLEGSCWRLSAEEEAWYVTWGRVKGVHEVLGQVGLQYNSILPTFNDVMMAYSLFQT